MLTKTSPTCTLNKLCQDTGTLLKLLMWQRGNYHGVLLSIISVNHGSLTSELTVNENKNEV